MNKFSHLNESGEANMVDITKKRFREENLKPEALLLLTNSH